jgi:hypothetical protein
MREVIQSAMWFVGTGFLVLAGVLVAVNLVIAYGRRRGRRTSPVMVVPEVLVVLGLMALNVGQATWFLPAVGISAVLVAVDVTSWFWPASAPRG